MKSKIGNALGRLGGYILGFNIISLAIPNAGLKECGYVTLGGCIIVLSTLLFED